MRQTLSDLDIEKARRELLGADGIVSMAAQALGVPSGDFRLLVYTRPELMDEVREAEARVVDEAEALLREAIRGGDIR